MYRGRIGTLVLLLFTMACGGGATGTPGPSFSGATPSATPGSPATARAPESPLATPDTGSSFTKVDDAIVGIIPAADIAEDGQPVDPGFTFSPDTPQITIVVQAGEVAGSPMDLKWFQATDDGEHELFTHTIDVVSFQTAYSVGTNPGMLIPGTYRVEATFAGESMSTTFRVVAPEESAIARTAGFRAPAGGAAGQGGEGSTSGPPTSGDSGAVGPRVDPADVFSGVTFLGAWLSQEPVDPGARDLILEINAGLAGGGGRVEAYVEMGGSSRTISVPTASNGLLVTYLRFDPCAHPGGSDLPGTAAQFVTNLLGDGSQDALADTVQNDTELGEDLTFPEVFIDAQPATRQVKIGDVIALDAIAAELADGPTWQTGLKSFRLEAQPGGLIGEEQRSAAGSAQPCGQKQWSLRSQTTYTIPADAPPVFDICGIAEDFAEGETSKCLTYYTGEVWGGPLTGRAVIPGCDPNPVPITGALEAVVADDGTVTGTVHEIRESFSCQGGPQSGVHDVTNSFTGTKTAGAFVLDVYGVTVTMPIVGTRAMGSSDHPGSGGHGVFLNYTLDCVTCGPT